MVAVLAVLCVSALLQNQLRYDMIRSRFQHSFVIQSVLHSYLVGFVLICYVQHCSCSHLPQCYFNTSVLSLKCTRARARGMSSMSSCLKKFSQRNLLEQLGAVLHIEISLDSRPNFRFYIGPSDSHRNLNFF